MKLMRGPSLRCCVRRGDRAGTLLRRCDVAHNETPKVSEIRLESGVLPKYAFPGGYPLYYLDAEGNILCAECARSNDDYTASLVDYAVNYEDAFLYCDHCSTRIESAYAEDEM